MRLVPKLVLAILALTAVGGCVSNPNQIGFGLGGGAGGALLGSQFGSGRGKLLATGAGALLGTFAGAAFGNQLDQVSRNQSGIIRNQNAIGARGAPQGSYAPTYYQMPAAPPRGAYSGSRGHSGASPLYLNCRVIHNYVQCDGQ